MTTKRIIRPQEAWTMVGFSRSTMYRLEAQGMFPRRIKIGPHASGYVYSEIEAWIKARIKQRDGIE